MALPGVNPTIRYLDDGSPDGTVLGQGTQSKIGLFGTTPQVQLGSVTTVTTTAAVSHSSNWGYSTSVQADAIVTALNTIIGRAQSIGITA